MSQGPAQLIRTTVYNPRTGTYRLVSKPIDNNNNNNNNNNTTDYQSDAVSDEDFAHVLAAIAAEELSKSRDINKEIHELQIRHEGLIREWKVLSDKLHEVNLSLTPTTPLDMLEADCKCAQNVMMEALYELLRLKAEHGVL